MSVFSQSFLTLVRRHFMSFSFFSAWHLCMIYISLNLFYSTDKSVCDVPRHNKAPGPAALQVVQQIQTPQTQLAQPEAHLKLYEEYGKHEDLCAYYMLSGNIEVFRSIYGKLGGTSSQKKRKLNGLTGSELFYGRQVTENEKIKNATKGGKVQGKINSENGHMKRIQKISDHSVSGKMGGTKTIELQKGAFGDPDERKKVASLGGKVQGKINSENGHCKKISQEYREIS